MKNQPKIDQNHRWSEKCRALRLGSRLGGVLEASWARLRGQDSSKLASQIEGKSIKKSMQKSIQNLMPSKFQFLCNFGGFLEGKRGHVGTKIGSQIEGKSINNECKHRSKNRCLLSSGIDAILIDYWRENGSMLAPESNQKSMSTSKGQFCKKH